MQYALVMLLVTIIYGVAFIAAIWGVFVVYMAFCGDIVKHHKEVREMRKKWQK